MAKEQVKTFTNGETAADIRNLCHSVDEVKVMITKLPCGVNTRIIERTRASTKFLWALMILNFTSSLSIVGLLILHIVKSG